MAIPSGALGIIALLAGTCLLAGFLTSVFGAIVAVDLAVTVLWLHAYSSQEKTAFFPVASLIVVAVAVTLLGPGAYSADARLFGMREIVITRSGPNEE